MLKKNMYVSRPSEHPPDNKNSKQVRWDLPDVVGPTGRLVVQGRVLHLKDVITKKGDVDMRR